MQIFTVGLNIVLLIVGFSFHFASYIIKTQIVGNNFFNFYFVVIFLQSFMLGIYFQITKDKNERGIPIGKILVTLDNKIRYLLIVLLLVGVVVVFYSISLMSGGGPDLIDGKYVLMDKGNIIKEISYEDYLFFNLLTFRIHSIGAIFFNIFDIILINYGYKRGGLNKVDSKR